MISVLSWEKAVCDLKAKMAMYTYRKKRLQNDLFLNSAVTILLLNVPGWTSGFYRHCAVSFTANQGRYNPDF